MVKLINQLRGLFEIPLFGVCSALADRLNVPTRYIRFNFVYISLLTFGSPILIYGIIAFWLNLKDYVSKRRSSVWEF